MYMIIFLRTSHCLQCANAYFDFLRGEYCILSNISQTNLFIETFLYRVFHKIWENVALDLLMNNEVLGNWCLQWNKGSRIVARLAHPAPTQTETAILTVLSST